MEGNKNKELTDNEVIDSLRQVMGVTTRTQKTIKTLIDFVDQKGLMKEFESYAYERFKAEQAKVNG